MNRGADRPPGGRVRYKEVWDRQTNLYIVDSSQLIQCAPLVRGAQVRPLGFWSCSETWGKINVLILPAQEQSLTLDRVTVPLPSSVTPEPYVRPFQSRRHRSSTSRLGVVGNTSNSEIESQSKLT